MVPWKRPVSYERGTPAPRTPPVACNRAHNLLRATGLPRMQQAASAGRKASVRTSVVQCVRAARPWGRARCGAGASCSAIQYQSENVGCTILDPRPGLYMGWEGYHDSRRCSRNTYPESYITKYTCIRGLNSSSSPKSPKKKPARRRRS